MAITFVGANHAATTSVALPAHQAGDVIVVYAMRVSSTTAPTKPADYDLIDTFTGTQFSRQCVGIAGYKVAASNSETSGTWTNANDTLAAVYRGCDQADPIGAVATLTSNGSTLQIPALTLEVGNGSSWVLVGVTMFEADSDLNTLSGLTRREEDGATPNCAIFDTDGGVSSFSQIDDTGYTSSRGKGAISFELKEPGPVGGSSSPSRLSLLGAG